MNAIVDVKRDMESATPMDRLLCGDVGYGKTEVAMRAAFKAVSDDRQVAVLAPDHRARLPALQHLSPALRGLPHQDRYAEPLPHVPNSRKRRWRRLKPVRSMW